MKKELVIKKSNSVINGTEWVKGNNNRSIVTPMGLTERKLMLFAIGSLQRGNKKVEIRVQEFYNKSDIGTPQYTTARNAALRLGTANIILENGNIAEGTDEASAIPVFRKIDVKQKTGKISFEFSDDFLPHIQDIKPYTTYLYKHVSDMDSDFGVRLYELLVQGIDKYKSRAFTLEEFKRKLGIEKVKSYAIFSKIKQKVIDPAVRNINAYSDIEVLDIVVERKGGKQKTPVERITFYMRPKPMSNAATKRLSVNVSPEIMDTIKQLQTAGIPDDMIVASVNAKHGSKLSMEDLQYILSPDQQSEDVGMALEIVEYKGENMYAAFKEMAGDKKFMWVIIDGLTFPVYKEEYSTMEVNNTYHPISYLLVDHLKLPPSWVRQFMEKNDFTEAASVYNKLKLSNTTKGKTNLKKFKEAFKESIG